MIARDTSETSRSWSLTRLEVCVVGAIVAVILTVIVMAIESSREAARKVQCLTNIRQLAMGANLYTDNYGCCHHRGILLALFTPCKLPYVGEAELYQQFDLSKAMDQQYNVAMERPLFLSCPTDTRAVSYRFSTSYMGNVGWMNVSEIDPQSNRPTYRLTGTIVFMGRGAPVKRDSVSDGLANSALFSEVLPSVPPSRLFPDKIDSRRAMWVETLNDGEKIHHAPEVMAKRCLAATKFVGWTSGAPGLKAAIKARFTITCCGQTREAAPGM